MNKRVHTFLKGNSSRLELELSYCDIAVQHVSHFATAPRLNTHKQLTHWSSFGEQIIFLTKKFVLSFSSHWDCIIFTTNARRSSDLLSIFSHVYAYKHHLNLIGDKKFFLSIRGVSNGCRWIVEFCWDDSEFRNWLLFLLLTPFTCLLFSVGSCKKIKDRRKEIRISFILKTLFWGLRLFCRGMFSWTSRNSRVSSTRFWNI